LTDIPQRKEPPPKLSARVKNPKIKSFLPTKKNGQWLFSVKQSGLFYRAGSRTLFPPHIFLRCPYELAGNISKFKHVLLNAILNHTG
jgi:hypothetical protein